MLGMRTQRPGSIVPDMQRDLCSAPDGSMQSSFIEDMETLDNKTSVPSFIRNNSPLLQYVFNKKNAAAIPFFLSRSCVVVSVWIHYDYC